MHEVAYVLVPRQLAKSQLQAVRLAECELQSIQEWCGSDWYRIGGRYVADLEFLRLKSLDPRRYGSWEKAKPQSWDEALKLLERHFGRYADHVGRLVGLYQRCAKNDRVWWRDTPPRGMGVDVLDELLFRQLKSDIVVTLAKVGDNPFPASVLFAGPIPKVSKVENKDFVGKYWVVVGDLHR